MKRRRSVIEVGEEERRPLVIDLFCGLGGWAEGFLLEGYDVIGYDIERHEYGEHRYPGRLVIRDVQKLHGRRFRNATAIVASPPCQEYSYRAMPWKKAKALPPPDNTLFEVCFRIQREASEAAGRHIPMVVENVRGAQKWVGKACANYGSFYLWGDVPALPAMPKISKVPGFRFDGSGRSFQTAPVETHGVKAPGLNWSDRTKRGQDFTRAAGKHAARKGDGGSWFGISHGRPASKNNPVSVPGGFKNPGHRHRRDGHSHTKHLTNPAEHAAVIARGTKIGGDWFNDPDSTCRRHSSKSSARKMASAMIAKIPLPLSRCIARAFLP